MLVFIMYSIIKNFLLKFWKWFSIWFLMWFWKWFTKWLKTVIIGLSDLSGQKFPLLLLKGWVIMDKIEMIRKAISGPLQEMEIEVDSIEFVKEGSYYFLRIVLDKINGIDMDTIVEATHVINPIIDELDPYEESYILDVLSKERGE